MHQRGWAYFQISGHLGDRPVSGSGCMPFVYAAARQHPAWLRMRLGREMTFVDTSTGARVYDGRDYVVARLPGGSFFTGLARPWMGLHCIDTIRRDAAKQRLPFETTYDNDTMRTNITVRAENVRLCYTVDMENDLIEIITFFTDAATEPTCLGEFRFEYLQEVPATEGPVFATPPGVQRGTASQQKDGMLWLARLASGREHH
jgi:hypothetical protein